MQRHVEFQSFFLWVTGGLSILAQQVAKVQTPAVLVTRTSAPKCCLACDSHVNGDLWGAWLRGMMQYQKEGCHMLAAFVVQPHNMQHVAGHSLRG